MRVFTGKTCVNIKAKQPSDSSTLHVSVLQSERSNLSTEIHLKCPRISAWCNNYEIRRSKVTHVIKSVSTLVTCFSL